MKKDLLPVTSGDEEYTVALASGAATAQKNIACLKIALKGLVIGALAFLSFFLDRWWELIQEMKNT